MARARDTDHVTRQQRAQDRRELRLRIAARKSYLPFLEAVWWYPQPLKIGPHTRTMAVELDKATYRLRDHRQSSYFCFLVPFRHGKSTTCTEGFVPWFIGKMRDLKPAIIITGYGADLVEGFSYQIRETIKSNRYRTIFPGIEIDRRARCRDEYWRLKGWPNEVHAAGLGGTLTGHGADLGICDDFCKKRKEIESPAYRKDVWDAVTQEFFTRQTGPAIYIFVGTAWHEKDVFGKIEEEMGKDPDFPRFKFFRFPARDPKTGRYLWTDFHPPEWYRKMYSILGPYGSSGLLDCNPMPAEGLMLKVQQDKNYFIHESVKDFPQADAEEIRVIDLASTEKEVAQNDPDFTFSVRGFVTWRDGIPEIWLTDGFGGQWGTAKRDREIMRRHDTDHPGVRWILEAVGGYKDTYNNFKRFMAGRRRVDAAIPNGPKFLRISALEPVLEAGNLHMVRGPWNQLLIDQLARFPKGHDDGPDAVGTLLGQYARPAETPRIWSIRHEAVKRAGESRLLEGVA